MENSSFGDEIQQPSARWSFDGKVPHNFVEHISKSVPQYVEAQDLAASLSRFFMTENTNVYDLGCSTGELTRKLAKMAKDIDSINIYGVDVAEAMIQKAQSIRFDEKIVYDCADLSEYSIKNASYVTSFYTMQFVHPSIRQLIFDKIYNGLCWGGAFALFEKVRGPDARFQDILTTSYLNYKLENGYTPDQILNKMNSLVGVLEPFSSKANKEMAERAGFIDSMVIFKYLNFEGSLFVK